MSRFAAVVGLAAFVMVVSDLPLTGVPRGLAKKGQTPPGFSQGEKKGWRTKPPKLPSFLPSNSSRRRTTSWFWSFRLPT